MGNNDDYCTKDDPCFYCKTIFDACEHDTTYMKKDVKICVFCNKPVFEV